MQCISNTVFQKYTHFLPKHGWEKRHHIANRQRSHVIIHMTAGVADDHWFFFCDLLKENLLKEVKMTSTPMHLHQQTDRYRKCICTGWKKKNRKWVREDYNDHYDQKKSKLVKCGCQGNSDPHLHMNPPWKSRRECSYNSAFCFAALTVTLEGRWHILRCLHHRSLRVHRQDVRKWKLQFNWKHLRAFLSWWEMMR